MGVTFDAGALIALERGNRKMIALLQAVIATGGRVHIPAGVVGQVWRNPARQAVLGRLLHARDVDVRSLDPAMAQACGVLCAAARTNDVIDASVVITAREHGDPIVTSDPDDLRHLDPTASIHAI